MFDIFLDKLHLSRKWQAGRELWDNLPAQFYWLRKLTPQEGKRFAQSHTEASAAGTPEPNISDSKSTHPTLPPLFSAFLLHFSTFLSVTAPKLRSSSAFKKKIIWARHQWLTPVILLERLKLRWRFKASPDKKFTRPHLQNNQTNMDWRHGSNGRVPALGEGNVITTTLWKQLEWLLCEHETLSSNLSCVCVCVSA
jgi:hypothetical protein